MPNLVPAAAEGLPEINRRNALALTGAGIVAALTGATVAVAKTGPNIADRIEAHRAALQAFSDACTVEGETEAAYRDAFTAPIIPLLLGGGYELPRDETLWEHSWDQFRSAFDQHRRTVKSIGRIAPDLAAAYSKAVDEQEAANRVIFDQHVEAEQARREAFGLGAAKRAWTATANDDDDTLFAIFAFNCTTPAETAMRAEYLLDTPYVLETDRTDCFRAMLETMCGRA